MAFLARSASIQRSDSTTYDHDAAGNLIQIAASAGTTTYDYDPWNRMTQATVPGDVDSTTLDYTYDALERLITKQDAAVAENTTTYAHSGMEEEVVKLTESDSTSSVTSRYLHLGQAPLGMERDGQIRFFGTDPHADVVYLANGSGTLVGDHSYSPWGEKRTASGEDPRFEFQGDLRDEDTGLVDMGARLYSPELGRFTTTDPLRGEADRPLTLNRYTYGLDNPVSNVDPTGLYVPQYGHQDRGTKTSPKRAQTASIGTSTSNVASSTRVSSAAVRAEQRHIARPQPEPRPAAIAPRRTFWQTLGEKALTVFRPTIAGIKELTGFNDVKRCIAGSTMACGLAAISFIPGGRFVAWGTKGLRFIRAGTSVARGTKTTLRSGRSADDLIGAACSFSGSTKVLMADGTRKPISKIEVGDYVLAEDPETGERGGRKVTRVWRHKDVVIDLEVDGGVVTTTEDHPFWNASDGEWQRADALDVGDQVGSSNGDFIKIQGLRLRTARSTRAFNLTVDGIHTYFVGVGDQEVLVHNTCAPKLIYEASPKHGPTSYRGPKGVVSPRSSWRLSSDARVLDADQAWIETRGGARNGVASHLPSDQVFRRDRMVAWIRSRWMSGGRSSPIRHHLTGSPSSRPVMGS